MNVKIFKTPTRSLKQKQENFEREGSKIPAQKGGTPLSNMYKITPALHTSDSGP